MDVFARSLLEILVPLVAVSSDEYHHPSGFSNITLVKAIEK